MALLFSKSAHLNIEIKAQCRNRPFVKKVLKKGHARFVGIDHQVDTYFKVPSGRLKLREGDIENHLIYYERKNQKGPKPAKVILYDVKPKSSLKEILICSLGVLAVVDKKREIYFIENIKFHLDQVKNLGSFIEIEAIDRKGKIGQKKLLEQCHTYLRLLKISKRDLISTSYSDLILKNKNSMLDH